MINALPASNFCNEDDGQACPHDCCAGREQCPPPSDIPQCRAHGDRSVRPLQPRVYRSQWVTDRFPVSQSGLPVVGAAAASTSPFRYRGFGRDIDPVSNRDPSTPHRGHTPMRERPLVFHATSWECNTSLCYHRSDQPGVLFVRPCRCNVDYPAVDEV
jgi:hypothetical protein